MTEHTPQEAPERIIATAHWRGNQYHTNFHCKSGSEKEFDRVEFVRADALTASEPDTGWQSVLAEIVSAADQWNSDQDKEAFERLGAAIDAARTLPAAPDAQPEPDVKATHWAIHSPTGTLIGLWDVEYLARKTFLDCPKGSTLTALRALGGGE